MILVAHMLMCNKNIYSQQICILINGILTIIQIFHTQKVLLVIVLQSEVQLEYGIDCLKQVSDRLE